MFCKTCATELVATAAICPKCGTPTDVAPKATALIVIGWLTAILFPPAGLVIGIVLCTKKHVGHGVGQIVVSVYWGFFSLILAAIAIPRFADTKDRVYVAVMKSDLRNLVTVEEMYFGDNITYTNSVGTAYAPSTGVTVTIGAADSTGWNATATHQGLSGTVCAIFVGTGPAVAPATNIGEPKCAP